MKYIRTIGLIACMLLVWLAMPSYAMPDKPDAFVSQVVLDSNSALVPTDLVVNSIESVNEITYSQNFAVDTALLPVTATDIVGVSQSLKGVSDSVIAPNISTASEDLSSELMVQIKYRNCTDLT